MRAPGAGARAHQALIVAARETRRAGGGRGARGGRRSGVRGPSGGFASASEQGVITTPRRAHAARKHIGLVGHAAWRVPACGAHAAVAARRGGGSSTRRARADTHFAHACCVLRVSLSARAHPAGARAAVGGGTAATPQPQPPGRERGPASARPLRDHTESAPPAQPQVPALQQPPAGRDAMVALVCRAGAWLAGADEPQRHDTTPGKGARFCHFPEWGSVHEASNPRTPRGASTLGPNGRTKREPLPAAACGRCVLLAYRSTRAPMRHTAAAAAPR
jgi:hypothetical protein